MANALLDLAILNPGPSSDRVVEDRAATRALQSAGKEIEEIFPGEPPSIVDGFFGLGPRLMSRFPGEMRALMPARNAAREIAAEVAATAGSKEGADVPSIIHRKFLDLLSVTRVDTCDE
jgi:hypothetical protein